MFTGITNPVLVVLIEMYAGAKYVLHAYSRVDMRLMLYSLPYLMLGVEVAKNIHAT